MRSFFLLWKTEKSPTTVKQCLEYVHALKTGNEINDWIISVYLVFSCGDPTRTDDLQVMSLASYQLLHSAMFKSVCFLFASAKLWLYFESAKCSHKKNSKIISFLDCDGQNLKKSPLFYASVCSANGNESLLMFIICLPHPFHISYLYRNIRHNQGNS